jgi:single-strand DNA-binding protein
MKNQPSDHVNLVVVRGTLSSDPRHRVLPSGTALLSWEVTTAHAERANDTVPVVSFDPPKTAQTLQAGDEVVVVGSVRRRFFRAGGATASRTEVVATTMVSARQAKMAARAIAAATAPLTEMTEVG